MSDSESFISLSMHGSMDSDVLRSEQRASSVPGCVPLAGHSNRPKTTVPTNKVTKLPYGQSVVKPHASSAPNARQPFTYSEASSMDFRLRTRTYLQNRAKAPCPRSIYELVAVDLYTTQAKHWHITRRMQLPAVAATTHMPDGRSLDDADLPPLLVMHLMMPMYPVTVFPKSDGPNCSFIYYFRLPQSFDPATFYAPQALRLLQQLAEKGLEPTALTPIRQQVKMIARLVNPQEWFDSGKLSRTELKLLEAWNAKPVLMRPCQRFYRGKNYLEIDFDLHSFSYFARKSLEVYINRLDPCVWDHGVCLEARTEADLPEVLLGGIRGHFWDFTRVPAFPHPALLARQKEDAEAILHDEADEVLIAPGKAVGKGQAAPLSGQPASEPASSAWVESGSDVTQTTSPLTPASPQRVSLDRSSYASAASELQHF